MKFSSATGTASRSRASRGAFERHWKGLEYLYGPDGSTCVPYATMRLSEGVSVFQLAANMGTLVEMIEKFYGKKRVRDPKAATELTKVG